MGPAWSALRIHSALRPGSGQTRPGAAGRMLVNRVGGSSDSVDGIVGVYRHGPFAPPRPSQSARRACDPGRPWCCGRWCVCRCGNGRASSSRPPAADTTELMVRRLSRTSGRSSGQFPPEGPGTLQPPGDRRSSRADTWNQPLARAGVAGFICRTTIHRQNRTTGPTKPRRAEHNQAVRSHQDDQSGSMVVNISRMSGCQCDDRSGPMALTRMLPRPGIRRRVLQAYR